MTSKNPCIYDPIMIFHDANKGLYVFPVLQFGFSDKSFLQSKTQLKSSTSFFSPFECTSELFLLLILISISNLYPPKMLQCNELGL